MEHRLLIAGELVEGEETLSVIEPATGRAFAEVACGSAAQLERAVAAAKAAQPAWAAQPLEARRQALVRLADAIRDNAEALARTLVREQGKPLPEAAGEILYTELFIRHFASLDLPAEVLQDDDDYRIELHHRPLGVVAGITPWNFPLMLAAFKLAPALLLGNSFILKPAPTTPVTSLMLGALAQPIFPAGVFSVITDRNDLGAALTSHPDVAKVSFTGSTATGKKVMAAAASTLKRITLELGGNDAAIVLGDVDVKTVAPKLFGAAFMNCGQVCLAVKRIYAHTAIYEALCEELARLAAEAVVGDGLQQGVTIGPLQNAAQFEKAKAYLETARRDGRVLAGGEPDRDGGYFLRPAIVVDIDDDSPLVQEEQFAPILPVVRIDDAEAALAKANAGPYGLGGSVWSADLERARALAERVESGTVWINHHLHFGPHIPFGGAKQSGIGTELSREGLSEFAQRTVVNISKAPVA